MHFAFCNSKLYLFQFFFTSYPQYNKSYFLVSFDFLTFVFCNLRLFFLNFSSRHSLNIINQISLYLNSGRLLWLSRGNKGYYSDRGNKNFVIPRGEAPRDDKFFVPEVWIISFIPEAKSQQCHCFYLDRRPRKHKMIKSQFPLSISLYKILGNLQNFFKAVYLHNTTGMVFEFCRRPALCASQRTAAQLCRNQVWPQPT